MGSIVKQELKIEEALKKKIEFICDFCNTTPTIYNGSVRTIERTNLSYIEPHRIIINEITYLAFNYESNVYVENLSKCIPLKDFNFLYNSIKLRGKISGKKY